MKVFLITLLIAGSAQAQVHRCTDATGKVSYTDADCPSTAKATRLEAQKSTAEIELQRERAAVARERFELQQERSKLARKGRDQEDRPMTAPAPPRVDSYACDVAKRNLGVGISAESRTRSKHEYEAACFGEKAADIQKAREGATRININTPPPTVIINR